MGTLLWPQVGAGCPASYWDHQLGHCMDTRTPELLRLFESPPGTAILLRTCTRALLPTAAATPTLRPISVLSGDEEQRSLPKPTFLHKWSFTGDFSLAHAASSLLEKGLPPVSK